MGCKEKGSGNRNPWGKKAKPGRKDRGGWKHANQLVFNPEGGKKKSPSAETEGLPT